MAPMTRSFSPGGVPGDNVAEYYRKRAAGGVGLIVTEGTAINRSGAANDPAMCRNSTARASMAGPRCRRSSMPLVA